MFLLCARGLQQHHVTVFMLLLLCKMFTIASFHGFLLSLFLSEVYCNIVLITGSCRQCCIQRFTSSSCYGVHVIVCKRFTASSCYGVHVIVCKRFTASFCYWFLLSLFCQKFTVSSCYGVHVVLSEVYSIIVYGVHVVVV